MVIATAYSSVYNKGATGVTPAFKEVATMYQLRNTTTSRHVGGSTYRNTQ